MDKAIIVDHLSYFNQLKDVSFTIQAGEMVGIIGSEESGKTTILKIISGLVRPTEGFISVLGYDPYLKSSDFLKQISYLYSEENHLLKNTSPIEILEITKEIYGLSSREFHKNLNELTKYISDPILLDALIYEPKIVMLDELNMELDPVYEYNGRNERTILLTAEKIDKLINSVRRVIILDEGQILFDGAIDEIVAKNATEKLIKAKLSSEIDLKEVETIGTVKKYTYPNLHVSAPRSIVALAAAEMMQNLPITSLTIEELPIEEIMKNMKI